MRDTAFVNYREGELQMKKYLVFVLALIVALLPAAALAEQGTASWVRLANPVVTMYGTEIANLDGLTIEGVGATTDDALLATLEILGGDSSAAKAYLEYADGWLNLTADGLSNVYSLPLEKMLAQGGKELSTNMQQVAVLAEVFSEENLEQLLTEISVPFVQFTQDLNGSMVVGAMESKEMPYGTVQMQRLDFTLSGEQVGTFVLDFINALLRSEMVAQLTSMTGQDIDAVLEDMDLEKTLSMYKGLEATAWADEAGNICIEERLYMADGDATVCTAATFYAYSLEGENGFHFTMNMNFAPQDGESVGEYIDLNFDMFLGEVEETGDCVFDMVVGMNGFLDGEAVEFLNFSGYYYPMEYSGLGYDELLIQGAANGDSIGEESSELTLHYYFSPADFVEYNYDETGITLYAGNAEEYANLQLLVQDADLEDGTRYSAVQFSMDDPEESGTLAYVFDGVKTETASGHETAGTLQLGAEFMGQTVELALDLSYGAGSMDLSGLVAPEKPAVNILSMGEKELNTLSSDGQILLMQFMGVLGANIPSISSLLGTMM